MDGAQPIWTIFNVNHCEADKRMGQLPVCNKRRNKRTSIRVGSFKHEVITSREKGGLDIRITFKTRIRRKDNFLLFRLQRKATDHTRSVRCQLLKKKRKLDSRSKISHQIQQNDKIMSSHLNLKNCTRPFLANDFLLGLKITET